MKKRVIALFCVFLALIMVGCKDQPADPNTPAGSGGNTEAELVATYGSKISSTEAKVLFDQLEDQLLDEENFEDMAFDKLTYTLNTYFGEASSSYTLSYSKPDKYYKSYNSSSNQTVYGIDDETFQLTNEVIAKINFETNSRYFYVDDRGYCIEAINDYRDGVEYKPEYKEINKASKTYRELAKNLSESQEKFNLLFDETFLDSVSGYFNYSSQIIVSIAPTIEMGNISSNGMTVEVRSKGENHLYMKYEMEMLQMSYECVIENGFVTYIKMSTPNLGESIPDANMPPQYSGAMTTELWMKPNVCEIEYPNLSTYTKLN